MRTLKFIQLFMSLFVIFSGILLLLPEYPVFIAEYPELNLFFSVSFILIGFLSNPIKLKKWKTKEGIFYILISWVAFYSLYLFISSFL